MHVPDFPSQGPCPSATIRSILSDAKQPSGSSGGVLIEATSDLASAIVATNPLEPWRKRPPPFRQVEVDARNVKTKSVEVDDVYIGTLAGRKHTSVVQSIVMRIPAKSDHGCQR